MRRALLFCLLCLPALAQDLSLAGLSEEGLIRQISELLAVHGQLRADLDAQMLLDLAQERQLAEHSATLDTLLTAGSPPQVSGPVWERVAAELAWSDGRLVALQQAAAVVRARGELLVAREAVLQAELELAARVLVQFQALLPFFEELGRRIAAERIRPEQVAETEEITLHAMALADDIVPAWEKALAALPAAREANTARAQEVATRAAERQEAHRQLLVRREDAELRRSLHAAVSTRDPQGLLGQISQRLERTDELRQSAPVPAETLSARLAAVDQLDARLRALTLPQAESLHVEIGLESWRKAKRAVLLGEARSAYYRRRGEMLRAAARGLEPIIDAVGKLRTHLDARHQATLDLDVQREILAEVQASLADSLRVRVPAGAGADTLAAQLRMLNAERARLGRLATERGAQRDTLIESQRSNSALLDEQEARLPALRAALAREEAWAAWSRELKELSNDELKARLASEIAALEANTARLTPLRERLRVSADRERAAWAAMRESTDPLVKEVQLALAEHRGDVLDSLTVGSPLPPLPGAPNGRVEEDRFDDSTWIATLSAHRNGYLARLRHFSDREPRAAALIGALQARAADWTALREGVAAALESARRVYGAAGALQLRQMLGTLSRAEAPAGLDSHASRDRAAALETDLAEVGAEEERARLRCDQIAEREATAQSLAKMIEQRLELTVRRITALRTLIELKKEGDRGARADGEVAERRRRQRVLARMQRDEPWFEPVLGLFSTDSSADLALLLEDDYVELIALEALGDNYEARTRKLVSLTALIRSEQELLAQVEPAVERRVERLAAEEGLLSLWARAMTALTSEQRELLLARLNQYVSGNPAIVAYARALPTPSAKPNPEQREGALSLATDMLFSTRCELLAHRDWLEVLRRARGRQGRLGRLEKGIAELSSRDAELAAREDERESALALLEGHTPEQLGALDPDDRPRGEELELYLQGRIGWTRGQLDAERMRAAGRTLFLLALIPFIAWCVIRTADRLGRRFLARFQRVPDSEAMDAARTRKQQEERATTVLHIFRAAFSVLVVAIAGVYLLDVLRIDVTPLIASAGILGLAVAFGAQPLMRDLFAGFFILLENQYKLGDFISINEKIKGKVEAISLRLTMLRDVEGVLHFIPNGNVDLVSNMTKDWAQSVLIVGASYNDSPDEVMACLRRVGEELRADPGFAHAVLDFNVLGVDAFADSAVNYRIVVKTLAGEQWATSREVRRRIKLAFDDSGITIPFPQRVVYHKYLDGTGPGPAASAAAVSD